MINYTSRFRAVLDIVVTFAMGAVAVTLLWRMTADANSRPSARGEAGRPAAVEDLRASRLSMSLTGAPTKGSTSAPVVMVGFTDFECPFCARFVLEKFGRLEKEFVSSGHIQYGFRHAPLKRHRLARPAAQAAECAARQGKFWDAHDYLFGNQARLALALWFKADQGVKINSALFEECMAHADEARIDADLLEASRFKIDVTPTFLIGRRQHDGGIQAHTRINGNQAYEVFAEALGAAAVDLTLIQKGGS
jgi:protein-disulfide isomerase